MANKSLEQVFDQIIKDAVLIANTVVRNVGQKIQVEMYEKANETLQQYYADYKPHIYKRTYSLQRSISPYTKAGNSKGILSLEVGIKYKPELLANMYESKSIYHQNSRYYEDGSSYWWNRDNPFFINYGEERKRKYPDSGKEITMDHSDNGAVDPEWILNNFLEGIHPRTDVSIDKNGKRTYSYNPYQGAHKPLKLMQDFVDKELEPKIQTYAQEELWNAVAAYF